MIQMFQRLFLCVIFAQPCSTCTVTIRLLFILLLDWGVGGDDLKPFVNLLSSSRTRIHWADLPWWEAQEWTQSPLHYLRCLYLIGCSSSSVTSHAVLLTVMCVLFCLKTGTLWGHKGKHWTNICLPLRIFLHVRLYRFNLLCFVTNNTDLLPSLIWEKILMKCKRKSNISRPSGFQMKPEADIFTWICYRIKAVWPGLKKIWISDVRVCLLIL